MHHEFLSCHFTQYVIFVRKVRAYFSKVFIELNKKQIHRKKDSKGLGCRDFFGKKNYLCSTGILIESLFFGS